MGYVNPLKGKWSKLLEPWYLAILATTFRSWEAQPAPSSLFLLERGQHCALAGRPFAFFFLPGTPPAPLWVSFFLFWMSWVSLVSLVSLVSCMLATKICGWLNWGSLISGPDVWCIDSGEEASPSTRIASKWELLVCGATKRLCSTPRRV